MDMDDNMNKITPKYCSRTSIFVYNGIVSLLYMICVEYCQLFYLPSFILKWTLSKVKPKSMSAQSEHPGSPKGVGTRAWLDEEQASTRFSGFFT